VTRQGYEQRQISPDMPLEERQKKFLEMSDEDIVFSLSSEDIPKVS
jgi:hypothetical protein